MSLRPPQVKVVRPYLKNKIIKRDRSIALGIEHILIKHYTLNSIPSTTHKKEIIKYKTSFLLKINTFKLLNKTINQ
jgi:hypothetical protein